jgi:hypothetical protein
MIAIDSRFALPRTLRRIALGLTLAASLAVSADAWAAPTDAEKTLAMERFKQGSAAFQQKRYKDAIDLFLEANAIVEHPAFAYNTALAYEVMGDASQALRWSREYLRRSPKADDRATIEATIRRLEVKMKEKGLMQLTVLSEPRGATLLVDGRPVGVTPWTGEIVPGSHSLELRLRGYSDASQSIELPADHSIDATMTLTEKPADGGRVTPPPVAPAPAPVAPPPVADVPAEHQTWMLPTSLTILGVAVASGATAIGLEVARTGSEQSARDAVTQVDAAAELDTMEGLQTGARVAAGVAGALALAGGVMLVVDLATTSDAPPATGPTASVRFRCGPLGCGAAVLGTF